MEENRKFVRKWGETKYKYIDLIVSSGLIKQEFLKRCKELSIDPYAVGLKASISTSILRDHYINDAFPKCSSSFPQKKFLKMIELVGIDVRVTVILKPLDKLSVEGLKRENGNRKNSEGKPGPKHEGKKPSVKRRRK